MLSIYIEETPITLERITKAQKNKDPKELKAAVHKFRSPAGLLSMVEAVKLAEFVELNAFDETKEDEIKIAVDKLLDLAKKSVEQAKAVGL